MIKFTGLVLLMVLQTAAPIQSAPETSEQITIHTLSCHALTGPQDLLTEALEQQGQRPKRVSVSIRPERGNLYAIGFKLKPGTYSMGITTAGCGDSFDLSIIPGHERHLSSYMYKGGLDYHDHGSISGSLPFPGLNIFARCDAKKDSSSLELSAVIDGNAYYFNNLPECRYSLFVSFAFSSNEVKLSAVANVTRRSPHSILDISLADVNTAGSGGLPFGTRLSIAPRRNRY